MKPLRASVPLLLTSGFDFKLVETVGLVQVVLTFRGTPVARTIAVGSEAPTCLQVLEDKLRAGESVSVTGLPAAFDALLEAADKHVKTRRVASLFAEREAPMLPARSELPASRNGVRLTGRERARECLAWYGLELGRGDLVVPLVKLPEGVTSRDAAKMALQLVGLIPA